MRVSNRVTMGISGQEGAEGPWVDKTAQSIPTTPGYLRQGCWTAATMLDPPPPWLWL